MTEQQWLEALDKLDRRLENIEKILAAGVVKQAASKSTAEPADDSDLDGQYGDPVVKKDPPKWKGDSFVGCKFSECSAEYLDNVAGFKMWQAGKEKAKGTDEGGKKAWYAEKDASRAAGWAKRIREGYTPPAAPSTEDQGEIPF